VAGLRTLYHLLQKLMRHVFSGDSALQNRPGHDGSPLKGEISPAAAVSSDSSNLFELFFATSCQLNVPELSTYEKQWRTAASLFCASEAENRTALSSVPTVEPTRGGCGDLRLPPVVCMMPVSPLKRADAKNNL
jgi:hypothetical protein